MCTYTNTSTHMHTRTCTHTLTHTHTHTHTHTQDNPMVDKRAHHNALERRRRDHIKDSFHDLRDCIPSLQGEKVDTFPSSVSSLSCPPLPAFPSLLFYLLPLSVSFLLPLVLLLLPSRFTFFTFFAFGICYMYLCPFRPSFSPPSSSSPSSSSHSSPSPRPSSSSSFFFSSSLHMICCLSYCC